MYILSFPNVKAVGIGPKISNDKSTGEMAIKIFVLKKVSKNQLTNQDILPTELDGYPTDVDELVPLKAN